MQRVYQLIIAQSICVAIILCSIILCKYLFKDTYGQLKDWYIENVMVDTDVNEVLSDEI